MYAYEHYARVCMTEIFMQSKSNSTFTSTRSSENIELPQLAGLQIHHKTMQWREDLALINRLTLESCVYMCVHA